jgi:GT2 family glycosyltransferase
MPSPSLSWGLIIPTYQREKILPTCLQLAVNQTRQPVEIIIVDGSDHWQATRDQVMAEIAIQAPEIRWVYVAADCRSSALQRNQGIALATADVVFLLDDDSFMYPTCAAEIMRVYEADPDGAVQGVQASLASASPTEVTVSDIQKATGWSSEQVSRFGTLKTWIWKHIFLMNAELLCIPYEQRFPTHLLPAAVERLQVYPVKLFHGCRMTFRRLAIAAEGFEPLLMYYAICEDMDASYRVSRRGALLEATEAQLYHFHSSSGRVSRYTVSALSALNQALFLRKNSDCLGRDQRRFYVLTLRRLVAELFKDALSRRWSLPQVRGLLTALRYAPTLFAMPSADLEPWYPSLQKQILEANRS